MKRTKEGILRDFNINGDHELFGQAVSNAQFKGKTLEALRQLEINHKELKDKLENHSIRIQALENFNSKILGFCLGIGAIGAVAVEFIFKFLGR